MNEHKGYETGFREGENAMTPQEHVKLKPCPLCNGRAILFDDRLLQEYPVIACVCCGLSLKGGYISAVLENWNTRHTPDDLRKLAKETLHTILDESWCDKAGVILSALQQAYTLGKDSK